jgi:diguanylate cyclase (GGDEF)-like protein
VSPDIRGVWLIGALGSCSFGLLLLVLGRTFPERLRHALSLWGIASICLGMGYTVRLARPWESVYVFHVLSSTLIATCLSLEWWTIRKLKRQATSTISLLVPPLIMFLSSSWFTTVHHNITRQLLIFNLLNMTMMLLIAFALSRVEDGQRPFPDLVAACVYVLLAVVTVGVLLDYIRVGQFSPEYDFNTPRAIFNGIAAIVTAGIVFPLFLLMISERLNRTLVEQAMRDPLTNLFNRRAFEEIGFREISGASRTGLPLSVLMFDIDRFKPVNDKYGHAAGDAVLAAASATLRSCLRDEDYLCRWGGDEFCALLPRADSEQAKNVAERVLRSLDEARFTHEGKSIEVAVSIGIATSTGDTQPLASLIERADSALYLAKRTGRKRFALAPPSSQTETQL